MDEIKSIILQNLKQRGDLAQLQAKVREAVMRSIEGHKASPPPQPEGETYVILELIVEFFRFLGLYSTAGTLEVEAGIPSLPVSREYLTRTIGLSPDAINNEIPLLYHMLAFCQQFGGVSAVVLEEDPEHPSQ